MLAWFRANSECPIDPAARTWLDGRWAWLERQFGVERVRNARLILPRADFFPNRFTGTPEDARALLDRVCDYMGIDAASVKLSLYEERTAVYEGQWHRGTSGLYQSEANTFRIWVEVGNLSDPLAMVGTMAHELGHVHLLGHGRISGEEEDHEPLTDLLTVFLGLGIFTANSVIRETDWISENRAGWTMHRRGYLGMPDYGYAFARFAQARGEDGSLWSRELRLDVRTAFKQSMRFLSHEASSLRDAGPS